MGRDGREQLRIGITKLAYAKSGETTQAGLLTNLSANGARIEFIMPLTEITHPYKNGDKIELIIDKMATIPANVVWCSNNELALNFTLTDEEEEGLIASMMLEMADLEVD